MASICIAASDKTLRSRARNFTRDITTAFSNKRSHEILNCIIVEGLAGFSCCVPRIRLFFEQQKAPVGLLILVGREENIPNNAVDDRLWDGRRLILLRSDELLSSMPSDKVQALLTTQGYKQDGKRNELSDGRSTARNNY